MSKTLYVEFRGRGFWAFDVVSGIFLKHLVDVAEARVAVRHEPWLVEAVGHWRFNAVVSDCGLFLDDKRFWCIFECAQALGVPIYLHPSKPHPAVMGAYFAGYEELALAAWGFGIDTGAHFLRLVFAGVFDAFPSLTFILGHLGEGLPFMLHRINDQTQLAAARRGLKKTPTQYLTENLVVTCSGNFSAPAFLCTVMALGVDNVLFSVDWPYESNVEAVKFLKQQQSLGLHEMEKIAHGNAERILHL